MDYAASQNAYACFDAVWPQLVQKIGAAVDGDPKKIKELQQAPYIVLQKLPESSADKLDPASTSYNTSASACAKTTRNRNPCLECQKKRQGVS